MTAISVQLDTWGNETGVPVKVELLNHDLDPIVEQWVDAKAKHRFEVEPGTYVVRSSVSSGRRLDHFVDRVECVQPDSSRYRARSAGSTNAKERQGQYEELHWVLRR